MGTNVVTLIGRLTAEPKLQYTRGGTEALSATIAVNRNFKNKQTGEYEADFIRFQAFGGNAKRISEWLTKGSRLAITGRIQTGNYEKDGIRHYTQDVVVDNFEPLESKGTSTYQSVDTQPDFGNEALPF